MVAVLAPLLVYFLLLSYVPLPDALVFSEESNTFTLVTARYNVLGTFILGSLSGFGSATTSWGYFPLRCGKKWHVDQFSAVPFVLIPEQCLGRTQPKQTWIV
jgi:The Golgi pH Regulator (GPHR) Family N-terminal